MSRPHVSPANRSDWLIRPDTTYLNHGSFGLCPRRVLAERQRWIERLQDNPMDFYLNEMETALDSARKKLAKFVGCRDGEIAFVDNATFGMNIVARSWPLQPGDEVLLNDHEYGAVRRTWHRRCEEVGAKLVVAKLPDQLTSTDDVIGPIVDLCTERTRIAVFSHMTSPTATIFPAKELTRRLQDRGVVVCIDGAHATGHVPVNMADIGCEFYTANCHKWLSAPLSSGFLYASSQVQSVLKPLVVSWGNSLSGSPQRWYHEFQWMGTRDPSALLAIPAAIDYLESMGLDAFRERGHALAQYFREQMTSWTRRPAAIPDHAEWYGCMSACPLPASVPESNEAHWHPLQKALRSQFAIEIPVINWRGRRYVRISCHRYNDADDVDRLLAALKQLIPT